MARPRRGEFSLRHCRKPSGLRLAVADAALHRDAGR